MADDSVSATTVINAPAEAIFAVLADPAKHAAVDGTGWVRETAASKPLTTAGQIFRMPMYHAGHPDGNYETANRVQVFDPPSTISWETGYEADDGTLRFGGWSGATTSRRLDPRTPPSLSPMTGQQLRNSHESSSDSRRSLRSTWPTR